jgi:RNA polymerase sigma-70 factor (ECF subfamily)
VEHTCIREELRIMEQSSTVHESEVYLVQQAIKRDRAAFTALYERCINQVYRHVYYRVSNHDYAEDITQETFVKAWKAIDKYKRTGAPFVTWLITIAGHLVIDHYRSLRNTINIDDVVEEVPGDHVSEPEALAEASFDNAIIKEAVLKLKGDKQKVILMHFIDGLTYEEIARALNKSEGSIRVIQYRALGELRSFLKRD